MKSTKKTAKNENLQKEAKNFHYEPTKVFFGILMIVIIYFFCMTILYLRSFAE